MKMIEKSSMFSYFFPVSSLHNTHTHTRTHTHRVSLYCFCSSASIGYILLLFQIFLSALRLMASLIPKVFSEKYMGTTLGRNRISALSDIGNLLTNATCEAKVSCHHTLHLFFFFLNFILFLNFT